MANNPPPSRPPKPREAILRMQAYSPPVDSRQGKLRFDFNENTRGCSPKVIETLRRVATPEFLSVYPEYEGARAKLGAFMGVEPGQVLLSDGTDEAIHILLQTYVEPGGEVVMPWPTFPMFRFYAQVAGAEPVLVRYGDPDLAFPLEELLGAIGGRTQAVVVANPNNPTGGAIGIAEIRRILEKAAGAAVLIDEAYFEFYGVTALGLLAEHPNLFISRTFSKAYGLAGLRVGCLLSNAANIAAVRKGQSPYSVNSLGVACALAAIEDQQYVRNFVAEALEARKRLYAALGRMGAPYWPSQANFVLANFGDRADEVCEKMRLRGMLLRPRGKEIAGSVRITLGDLAQTGELIAALEDVWKR